MTGSTPSASSGTGDSARLLTLYCHECAKKRPFRFSYARRDGDYAVHVYRCVVCNGRHETKIKLDAVPIKESEPCMN